MPLDSEECGAVTRLRRRVGYGENDDLVAAGCFDCGWRAAGPHAGEFALSHASDKAHAVWIERAPAGVLIGE